MVLLSAFWTAASISTSLVVATAAQPQAFVYRGPAACDDCPEAVAALLKTSPSGFNVTFIGPKGDIDISDEALADADVYAQPGGGDVDPAWNDMKQYAEPIRNFVANGGVYMGFCLGAYLAGDSPGFGLQPQGDGVDAERDRPGAQVTSEDDAIINVDWTFSTGNAAGTTQFKRWLFFQDGAVIDMAESSTSKVLGRYSSNGDIAASLTAYQNGWVGLVGPHPEADQSWYDSNLTNPDGIKFDIGYDFVETTFKGLSSQASD